MKVRTLSLGLIVLLSVSLPYAEDPIDGPGTGTGPTADAASFYPEAKPLPEWEPPKNIHVANALFFGTTILPLFSFNFYEEPQWPLVISATALAIGPSTGQLYAGSILAGTSGILIRSLGLGLITYGMGDCLDKLFGEVSCSVIPIYSGLAFVVGGVFYGLIDTQKAVNRANRRARKAYESKARLSPMLYPDGRGRFLPGLAFTTSF